MTTKKLPLSALRKAVLPGLGRSAENKLSDHHSHSGVLNRRLYDTCRYHHATTPQRQAQETDPGLSVARVRSDIWRTSTAIDVTANRNAALLISEPVDAHAAFQWSTLEWAAVWPRSNRWYHFDVLKKCNLSCVFLVCTFSFATAHYSGKKFFCVWLNISRRFSFKTALVFAEEFSSNVVINLIWDTCKRERAIVMVDVNTWKTPPKNSLLLTWKVAGRSAGFIHFRCPTDLHKMEPQVQQFCNIKWFFVCA